jgi:CDP-glucose 4,6-dehydratase
MADLMRGLLAGEDVIIRRPRAVRPWQHVLEPLSGYLETAEQICKTGPLPFDSWNFGPQSSGNRTVAELAELTCGLWGRPEAMRVREDPSDPHEAGLLTLDSTKASTKLGWRPRWGFEDCVKRTVDWYRAYAGGDDMRSFSLDQIEAYERAVSPD